MGIKVGKNKIDFVERRGIKYLKEFWAFDKNFDPVQIRHKGRLGPKTTLIASDLKGNQLGKYELEYIPQERTIKSPLLLIDEKARGRHIGQLLTLSGILEFRGNRYNRFKLFSLGDTMGFHAKMGFVMDSDDLDYIKEGLRAVLRSKAKYYDDIKTNAKIYTERLKDYQNAKENEPAVLARASKIISDFMKELLRHGDKKNVPDLIRGSHFRFTDWELLTEKNYLNKLLEEHHIDYRL